MKSDEDRLDRIDLAPLDPGNWQQKSAALAARALQMRRFRRAVVVRGMTALALSAAAAVALWFAAPSPQPHAAASASSFDPLSLTMTTDPTEVLRYAQ